MQVALIPARSGSERVSHKNIRKLAGHPLLAYSIQVARDSGLFGEHVYVVSDSDDYLSIARDYGVGGIKETPISGGHDSWWIAQALIDVPQWSSLIWGRETITNYFILRPTSPFRTVEMLKRASSEFNQGYYPILKAMEPVKQRPEKMWYKGGDMAYPYKEGGYHYEPSISFEDLYIQNASLEIRKYGVPMPLDGPITPFLTQGYEGFDINTEDDWILAEALVERGMAKLPEVK